MSRSSKFLLVSLPSSISNSSHKEDALEQLGSTVGNDNGTTYSFSIPDFKIGSLDALVQQADDLTKLSTACEAVVFKVSDTLSSIFDGDESKISGQKLVNDKPVDQYLRSFQWNKVKYRSDKPISDIIDSLQKEISGIDNDVKTKFSQYNSVRTNLNASKRRQDGNLSTKSLVSIVPPSAIVKDSEYLETHLVAVPNQSVKEYLKSYESLTELVVPRSSTKIAADDDFTLFAVTTFKKTSNDFLHKCREHRWIPRDFKYKSGGKEEETKETENLEKEERKLFGEVVRLSRTGYSDSTMIWIHVLVLRVFVETVLRYGLPLDFVCGLIQTTEKGSQRAKKSLDSTYSYLAGNAFGKDKKGKTKKDDASVLADLQAAGHGEEYTAYVYFEFDIV